jgi:hypothetical protein
VRSVHTRNTVPCRGSLLPASVACTSSALGLTLNQERYVLSHAFASPHTHTHTHACMYTNTHHTHTCTCTRAHTHTRMHACMETHIHTPVPVSLPIRGVSISSASLLVSSHSYSHTDWKPTAASELRSAGTSTADDN